MISTAKRLSRRSLVLSCAVLLVAGACSRSNPGGEAAPSAGNAPIVTLSSLSVELTRTPNPGDSRCKDLWAAFIAARPRGASPYIALLAPILVPAQAGTRGCGPAVREELRAERARAVEAGNATEARLLAIAADDESAALDGLASAPELLDGTFFADARPADRAVLRSLVCSRIGALVANFANATSVTDEVRAASRALATPFAEHCIERELRRRALQAIRATGGPS